MALLVATAAYAYAQEPRPFVRGSLQSITSEYHGRSFVLAVWSLDCVYCRHDLALLSSLRARYPDLVVVAVATDPIDRGEEVTATLAQLGLGAVPSWVFADRFVERLRFEIDSQWFGELPRTYFYAPDGSRVGVSGSLEREAIERWVTSLRARPDM
jgi:hypothetical protein